MAGSHQRSLRMLGDGSQGRGDNDMVHTNMESSLAILRTLGDANRLRIVELLAGGEHCVCEMTEILGLAPNTVSHHVRLLSAQGLVVSRKKPSDRRWIYYRIDPETLRSAAYLLMDWAESGQAAPDRDPICPV